MCNADQVDHSAYVAASFHLVIVGIMNICFKSIVSLALLVYVVFPNANADDTLKTIFFRLYHGTIDNYTDAHLDEAATLIDDFDLDYPTAIYIHGYTESVNSSSVHTIENAYLKRSNHNLIAVDWSVLAGEDYLRVSINVEPVGKAVARAIDDLVNAGLPSETIHVIGHSMGAHVAAYVGRNVDFSLQRITGLDPAGPLFNVIGDPLARNDAKFVDIIHTDKGFYGIARATGNIDFSPNGGHRIQPGCPILFLPLSEEDFCSHHRSWYFYAESVVNETAFLGTKCSPSSPRNESSDLVVMGYATPPNTSGIYCLVTNSESPFGEGIKGAHQSQN